MCSVLNISFIVCSNVDSTNYNLADPKPWFLTSNEIPWFCLGPNKHQSAVTCLQFNKNFVITSSDDGTVKLWDLKTGEFIRNLVTLESGGSGGVVWRIRASNTKLVCAVGSRNGTEETKLLVLDFDVDMKWRAGKGASSPLVGDGLPTLPPAKEKKEKRKNIPCSQWCRMLAWGNRAKRPTDAEGKEEAMTNHNWQERCLPALPGRGFTLDWGQLCNTRLSKSNQVQLFLYFLLQWSLGSVTAEMSLQIRWPVLLPLRPRKKLQ